jgi:hypothetical protein
VQPHHYRYWLFIWGSSVLGGSAASFLRIVLVPIIKMLSISPVIPDI